jgi:hypothetical protein
MCSSLRRRKSPLILPKEEDVALAVVVLALSS